jgi:hypothetical protein
MSFDHINTIAANFFLLVLLLLLKHQHALLAIPFAVRLGRQSYTREVKPFVGAILIITSYHVTIRYIVAETIGWLSRLSYSHLA